jgi:hypothetical protein
LALSVFIGLPALGALGTLLVGAIAIPFGGAFGVIFAHFLYNLVSPGAVLTTGGGAATGNDKQRTALLNFKYFFADPALQARMEVTHALQAQIGDFRRSLRTLEAMQDQSKGIDAENPDSEAFNIPRARQVMEQLHALFAARGDTLEYSEK